jgi:hypothetical protein
MRERLDGREVNIRGTSRNRQTHMHRAYSWYGIAGEEESHVDK